MSEEAAVLKAYTSPPASITDLSAVVMSGVRVWRLYSLILFLDLHPLGVSHAVARPPLSLSPEVSE